MGDIYIYVHQLEFIKYLSIVKVRYILVGSVLAKLGNNKQTKHSEQF